MTIEITNTTSTISAPPELLDQLRHFVSYRAEELPPREVQRLLKRWHGRVTKRWGYEADLERLYQAHEGRELEALGWPPTRWTIAQFEAVLRNPGIWDGWKTLINSRGEVATGLISHVKRTLTLHLGLTPSQITTRDSRPTPSRHTCELACARGFPLRLWPHQEQAVEAWEAAGFRGVWDLPPRSGKTRASALAIARVGVPSLVVVPRVGLVKQAAEGYREVFGDQVLELHGSAGSKAKLHRQSIRHPLWVSTPRTALTLDLSTRQLLVIDEYHHAAADTYQAISLAARNAYYRLGQTGTHYRADNRELIMHGVAGPAVYRASVGDMVGRGVLAPGRVAMLRGAGTAAKVSQNKQRDALAAWVAQCLIAVKKRVLVLAVEVAHVRELAAAIPGAVAVDARKNKELPDILSKLMSGAIPCVVGTSVIGEGVDVPAADALVYVCGSRSRVKVVQDVYRVLTASPGKAHGLIVDFADEGDDGGIQRAADRLYEYRRNGFDVSVINAGDFTGWLSSVRW